MELDLERTPEAASFDQAVKVGLMVGPMSGALDRVRGNVILFCAKKFKARLEKDPNDEVEFAFKHLWNEIFECDLDEAIAKLEKKD